MTEDQPQISVLTDISANIFAVFIVILIVLLALPHDEPQPAPPPKSIDAVHDLVSVTRSPLGPTELVDLLFARRRASDSISIDLFNDRVVVARLHEPPEEFSLPLNVSETTTAVGLAAASPEAPVGLYVFDHGGYAAVLKLLGERRFREISVPAALRGVVDQRQDWREGFRSLIDRTTDIDAFREDLSRLLASPDPSQANAPRSAPSGQGKGQAPIVTDALPADGLIERLAIWLQRALAVGAVSLGLALIAWVEWRRSRPPRRKPG